MARTIDLCGTEYHHFVTLGRFHEILGVFVPNESNGDHCAHRLTVCNNLVHPARCALQPTAVSVGMNSSPLSRFDEILEAQVRHKSPMSQ